MNFFNKINHGFINTNDGFELYYEVSGNPEGIPILFLHGGPGLGCKEEDYAFFDADKHMVILFDQRGAPKSKPKFQLKGIEPLLMVEDVKILLDTLSIESINLFGGSWGATLALLFGIHYPERVKRMLLRGTFVANQSSIDSMFKRTNNCNCWKTLINDVPLKGQQEIANFYFDQMAYGKMPKEYALRWINYSLCLNKSTLLKEIDEDALFKAKIIALFSRERCFLSDDYIFNNANQLRDIPIVFVQGINDLITPTIEIERLTCMLPISKLIIVNAGHFAWEMEIKATLIDQIDKIFI